MRLALNTLVSKVQESAKKKDGKEENQRWGEGGGRAGPGA